MSTTGKLTALTLACCLSSLAPAADTVRGARGEKIDRYMTRHAQSGFSGVILAAADDDIIIAKGYGLANDARKIPFTAQTVFTVGSLTKQFTGAAILKLEMQGKLRVTDTIDKFFDDVPEDKRAITLHHLLTHSSGLKPAFGDDFDPVTRDQIIRLCMDSKLLWPPGTQYRYSNAGFSLLGAIIEIVTGDSYERYLHDELFKPAGMMHTGYQIPEWDPDQMAHGYLSGGKDWGTLLDHRWADDGPYWNLRANGGIMSTAEDLLRWHRALGGNKILSDKAKAKYFTPHVKEGPDAESYYGYGWVVVERNDGSKAIWHDGSNGIFFADMIHFTGDNVVLIMASNRQDHDVSLPKLAVVNMLH